MFIYFTSVSAIERTNSMCGFFLQVASDTGKETTYLQLLERVTTLACSLQRHGLVKEDIVSIICANCPEFPVMALAVLLAGGIVHTLSPLYTVCKSHHPYVKQTWSQLQYINSGYTQITPQKYQFHLSIPYLFLEQSYFISAYYGTYEICNIFY